MKSTEKSFLKEITWKKARELIAAIDPNLIKIIDNVNPDDSFTIYHARYPFGATIFKEAVLHLPIGKDTLPYTSPSVKNEIRENLSYRIIPMCYMLKNSTEMFFELQERLATLMIVPEGTFLGAWETLDSANSYFTKMSWNFTSGARSLFMLPKISEEISYKRLQKNMGIHIDPPRTMKGQWRVFKALANHPSITNHWYSEMLIFSRKWFEKIKNDPAWLPLQNYLYQISWQGSMYYRFLITNNLIWSKFIELTKSADIPCEPYYVEILRHIINIALGGTPAFKVAGNDETLAPIKALQKIFIENYDIEYIPTLMIPHHFNLQNETSFGYYSINEPTMVESVPRTKEFSNVMAVTQKVRTLFDCFKEQVVEGSLAEGNTLICNLINNADFAFYHPNYDPAELLLQTKHLVEENPEFLTMPSKKQLDFCHTSAFLKGCVRMKKK
jgi:hypothetical protein